MSDSLAGESISSGGAFAAKNPGVGVSPQPAHGTTTNNTDTTNATELKPASSAAERDDGTAGADGALKAGQAEQGKGKEEGRGPTFNTTSSGSTTGGGSGNGSGQVQRSGGSGGDRSTQSGQSSAQPGANISTNTGTSTTQTSDSLKPKGANLHEGGAIDGSEHNASFEAGVGSKDNPSRLAEQQLQNRNADAPGNAAGSRDFKATGKESGGYEVLGEEKLA